MYEIGITGVKDLLLSWDYGQSIQKHVRHETDEKLTMGKQKSSFFVVSAFVKFTLRKGLCLNKKKTKVAH